MLFLGHLSLVVWPWILCSTSFSTFVPNLGNVLFSLILWYPLFHHKGKQNLLSGKDFYPSMPSPIVSYIYHFPLLTPACACTTFPTLLSHIFYIFPNGFLFQTNHVVFYTHFGLTCYICIWFIFSSAFLRILHLLYSWVLSMFLYY